MKKIIAYIIFKGDNADWSVLSNDLNLLPLSANTCKVDLYPDSPNEFNKSFNNIFDYLYSQKNKLGLANINEIILYLNLEYSEQCNWEFSVEEIKKLANLNCSLAFTAYKVEA